MQSLEQWREVEDLKTAGDLEICLKSEILGRTEEVEELGQILTLEKKLNVCSGIPQLVQSFGQCPTGDAGSSSEDAGQKDD